MDLRDQLTKSRALAGKHEQHSRKLEHLVDQMQQDVRRLKRVELLYDDEQHQRIEAEQRRLRELEELAQRYEGERLREAERARGQMEEVLREVEAAREAERLARVRGEEAVRAKEEEVAGVWAARMQRVTDENEGLRQK